MSAVSTSGGDWSPTSAVSSLFHWTLMHDHFRVRLRFAPTRLAEAVRRRRARLHKPPMPLSFSPNAPKTPCERVWLSQSRSAHRAPIGELAHWPPYALIVGGVIGLFCEQSARHVGPFGVSPLFNVIVDPIARRRTGRLALTRTIAPGACPSGTRLSRVRHDVRRHHRTDHHRTTVDWCRRPSTLDNLSK